VIKTFAGPVSIKPPVAVPLATDTQSSANQGLIDGNVQVSVKGSNNSQFSASLFSITFCGGPPKLGVIWPSLFFAAMITVKANEVAKRYWCLYIQLVIVLECENDDLQMILKASGIKKCMNINFSSRCLGNPLTGMVHFLRLCNCSSYGVMAACAQNLGRLRPTTDKLMLIRLLLKRTCSLVF